MQQHGYALLWVPEEVPTMIADTTWMQNSGDLFHIMQMLDNLSFCMPAHHKVLVLAHLDASLILPRLADQIDLP